MDDAWYTEQDNHGESNWNKMQDEFVNVRMSDPLE